MSKLTRGVVEDICMKAAGHKIVSLPVKEFVDPVSKGIIRNYEILCERCGLSIEKLRNYRPYYQRKIQQEK